MYTVQYTVHIYIYILYIYIYIYDFSFWVCRRKMILLHKSLGFANQQVVAFPLGMDVKGTQDLIIQKGHRIFNPESSKSWMTTTSY